MTKLGPVILPPPAGRGMWLVVDAHLEVTA